ncbi:MAG TPA: family 1 glycosylhydrolase [Candidatus Saccharimonadales bacterium]|nr:family 1 glycosylhydrolase [Candidatus Saccharimonadales bacterium]
MKKDEGLLLKFPGHFLWGAASAAHQVEGSNHNQWTVWELEHAKILAETAKYQANYLPKWDQIKADATNPANYVSGKATDHYNRYQEDFALIKKLNMNAWRFSIEWSRVEPEEGAWNAEAIEHYRVYLKKLAAIGVEPIVTLWHWTVPVWFEQKGGFTKRSNIGYFLRFAEKVFDELGQNFRYVITLNEPEVYAAKSFLLGEWPPQRRSKTEALVVLLNLISVHKKVYKAAKKKGRKYLISIAKNTAHHYAGDDAVLSQTTAKVMSWVEDGFLLGRIKKYLDFIGLNYYFSNRYYGYRQHNENLRRSDLGWDMRPADIEIVLKQLYDQYNLPIIITENGLADHDDEFRKWWLSQTLMAMHRAIQSGVRLEGYLHWSLTDNFEWSSGFWPRFGLAEVDYKTKKRTLRPSAIWFGKIIKQIRG